MQARCILVVDDEPDVRTMVHLFLQGVGYQVVVARNAEEALARCAQEPVQGAVVDINLPGMSGIELCQILTTTYHLPVLLMSANLTRAAETRNAMVGAAGFLPKPFALTDLLQQIQQIMPAQEA